MQRFADLTFDLSGGEVQVQVFAGAQLGTEPENIEQVQLGIVDLARVNSVVLANVSPSIGAFTLPYVFRDETHKYEVLDGEIGGQVRADLHNVGLLGFGYLEAGTRHFYSVNNKPIVSLEDLIGLKIRVQPAEISLRMIELLGATPTPMNFGEVYTSLQTGVIDGAENDFVSYYSSGHFNVAPNYTIDGHLSPPAVLIMNKRRFDALEPRYQYAIEEAARRAVQFQRELMRKAEDDAARALRTAGVSIIEVDSAPFRNAITPIYSDFEELWPIVQRIQRVGQDVD